MVPALLVAVYLDAVSNGITEGRCACPPSGTTRRRQHGALLEAWGRTGRGQTPVRLAHWPTGACAWRERPAPATALDAPRRIYLLPSSRRISRASHKERPFRALEDFLEKFSSLGAGARSHPVLPGDGQDAPGAPNGSASAGASQRQRRRDDDRAPAPAVPTRAVRTFVASPGARSGARWKSLPLRNPA